MPPFRFVHFGDLHLPIRRWPWTLRDLATKRLAGYVNARLLGRGRRFKQARAVLAAFAAELEKAPPDAVVFSGDASNAGYPAEFAEAAGHFAGLKLPGVAVPGNHDYYTAAALTGGPFEAAFAPWQEGLRVGDHAYPFARKLGPAWFIGVNAATPNRVPFDASGEVGPAQLARLRELCARLDGGLRVLVMHYPLRKADGACEGRWRILRDRAAVEEVARDCGVGLWLNGHIHRGYFRFPSEGLPFAQLTCGSATQTGRWMFADCTLDGGELRGAHRVYDPRAGCFRPGGTFAAGLRT